jgi:hypothetical protein
MSIDENAVKTSGFMRIFIFKSETSPELRAFGGDLAGSNLPVQFRPWYAIGAIAPEGDFPYKLSRQAIETAINDCRDQLWRMRKKNKPTETVPGQ